MRVWEGRQILRHIAKSDTRPVTYFGYRRESARALPSARALARRGGLGVGRRSYVILGPSGVSARQVGHSDEGRGVHRGFRGSGGTGRSLLGAAKVESQEGLRTNRDGYGTRSSDSELPTLFLKMQSHRTRSQS